MSLGAGSSQAAAKDLGDFGVLMFPVSIAWLAAIAVRLDWDLGFPRVLLSLPFTAKQIGRAVWWTGVGVPTLLFALFSSVGIFILNVAGVQGRFLEAWFEMVIAYGLSCGSIFWLFSGAPLRPGGSWQKRFLEQLYGWTFFFGLVGGIYFFYKSTLHIEVKTVIACFFGFVFSVLGWLRAEGLVIDFGSYRREIAGTGRSRGKFKPRPGFGGVPYLMVRSFARYLAIALIFFAVLVGWCFFQPHRYLISADDLPLQLPFQFSFFSFCFLQIITIGAHLKFLRSLPLTSKELAATILCLAMLPILILTGFSTTLFLTTLGLPATSLLLKCYLLSLAPACVLITAVVWYSEERLERIIISVFAFAVSVVPFIYQSVMTNWDTGSGGLPIWFIIAYPVAAVFIALLTISRLLERNDMTYRIRVGVSGVHSGFPGS
jgi:hypothetical protein